MIGKFALLCVPVCWFLLLRRFAIAQNDDITTVQYNSNNFAEEVTKKNHFVMFYAPWCGHCQRLEPMWEQLAEMLNEDDSNIRIAKVDCTADSKVCSEQDVTGYPTLKFFKAGSLDGVKFKGTRDLPSLTSFINDQLGQDRNEEELNTSKIPETSNSLNELTEDTFEKHVSTGKHFVKFYAPWCGHCQKLAPTWEKLANSVEYDTTISISKIDCTQHRSVCSQFDIKGYPTLLWIEDGKKIDKYQGQRTHEDLKAYVSKMLGSNEDPPKEDSKDDDKIIIPVFSLTSDDFEHGIKDGITFIKFFAPWCGHCKHLAPIWEQLGIKFVDNPKVNIAKVDCTAEMNKQLCNAEEVDGFPTLLLYKNGKKLSEYNGSRTLNDLYEFVTKHLSDHDEL